MIIVILVIFRSDLFVMNDCAKEMRNHGTFLLQSFRVDIVNYGRLY